MRFHPLLFSYSGSWEVTEHKIICKEYITKEKNREEKPNFEHGSQPLNPTIALKLARYALPSEYFPAAKQVAEYIAVAAPMLKPPIPSLTVT